MINSCASVQAYYEIKATTNAGRFIDRRITTGTSAKYVVSENKGFSMMCLSYILIKV